MRNLSDPSVIQEICRKYQFSFSKGMGQNFLIDPEVCPKIATQGIPNASCGVLEIGPGFGVLTRELASRAERVVAVEVDKRLAPVLKETLVDFHNIQIIWNDILKLSLVDFLQEHFGEQEIAVCANLPYYITTPILMKLLESDSRFISITIMVQKEVAERLCASVGTRVAGAITAAVQLRGKAEYLFPVPREAFYPEPNVDSAVIRISPYDKPFCSTETMHGVLKLVKAGFLQRRKTALNGLSAALSLPKEEIRAAFEICSFPETLRMEQLNLQALIQLYEAMIQVSGRIL